MHGCSNNLYNIDNLFVIVLLLVSGVSQWCFMSCKLITMTQLITLLFFQSQHKLKKNFADNTGVNVVRHDA